MEMAMVITDAMVTEKEWLLLVSVLLPDSEAVLSDEDIIKAAYAFWFADKDWVGKWGKIWTYMCSNQAK